MEADSECPSNGGCLHKHIQKFIYPPLRSVHHSCRIINICTLRHHNTVAQLRSHSQYATQWSQTRVMHVFGGVKSGLRKVKRGF